MRNIDRTINNLKVAISGEGEILKLRGRPITRDIQVYVKGNKLITKYESR